LAEQGINPRDLQQGSPGNGMERSYDELVLVYEKTGDRSTGQDIQKARIVT